MDLELCFLNLSIPYPKTPVAGHRPSDDNCCVVPIRKILDNAKIACEFSQLKHLLRSNHRGLFLHARTLQVNVFFCKCLVCFSPCGLILGASRSLCFVWAHENGDYPTARAVSNSMDFQGIWIQSRQNQKHEPDGIMLEQFPSTGP